MLDFLRPSCLRETKCQEELRSVCGLNSLVSFLIIFHVLWLFEGVDVFEILPALIPYLWINQSSIIPQI